MRRRRPGTTPGLTLAVSFALAACGGLGGDQGELGRNGGSATTPPTSAPPRPPGLSAPLPTARTEIAGTAWSGKLVVAGGLTAEGRASNLVDIYDPADDSWSSGPPLPRPIHHAAMVAGPGGRLWVIGGYSMQGQRWVPEDDVWSLGPDRRDWRQEPPLRTARGALAAAIVSDAIVAAGGATMGDGRPESVSRVVEFIRPGDKSWSRGPDMNDQREHLAMTSTGSRAIAIAGRLGSLDSNLRSVESWAVGEDTWRRESPLQKERAGFAATTVAGVPCVVGGEQPKLTISLVECLRNGRWRVVAQLGHPRHGLVAAGLAGRLHAVGGGPEPGLTTSDVHEVIEVGSD